jgi:mono/diheme cytochrome c family protein
MPQYYRIMYSYFVKKPKHAISNLIGRAQMAQGSVNVGQAGRVITGLGITFLSFIFGGPISPSQAQTSYAADVKFLDQNWSRDERLAYYFTSQGSAALRYDIFLNIEQADNADLLRSDANLSRYGFLSQPTDPVYNPDGLPIGIAKTSVADGRWKGQWVGLTCAACHNGEIQYRGTKIRITGGNNARLDILAFIGGLDDALQATVTHPEKFERLATRLGRQNSGDRDELRRELLEDAEGVHIYRTRTALTPTIVGPGRVDALALIHNQVMATQLGVPENWRPALAPAKYSFTWNIPQSAWAQWSGVLPDPVLRNGGESIGVFVRSDFISQSPSQGLFDSTINFPGQIVIEELLRKLAPPRWPEELLGRIDQTKAAAGKQLFVDNCAGCHSTWPHRWSEPRLEGHRFIENAIVGQRVVGTDPMQFGNPQFNPNPNFRPGALAQFLVGGSGVTLATADDLFGVIRTQFFRRKLDELKLSPEARNSAHGFGPSYPDPQEPAPAVPAYKANPAEGMWANPPYLHNGSVPNLYELLLPAAQRSKRFFIGREFDPVHVGFDTLDSAGFDYDTSLLGNSNAGHSFENGSGPGIIGRLFSDEERWTLIEYLKSIPEVPAQVTPYGGPAKPVSAWHDPTFYHVRKPGTFNGAPN